MTGDTPFSIALVRELSPCSSLARLNLGEPWTGLHKFQANFPCLYPRVLTPAMDFCLRLC